MQFSTLFKKYRLRSEFETLEELREALEDIGYTIKSSTLSRWQKGDRTPRTKDPLLKLISLFVEKEGITSLTQANDFLTSAGQEYLTTDEIESLPVSLISNAPFQAPQQDTKFVGRVSEIHTIDRLLKAHLPVVISGPTGIGKTKVAVQYCHQFKSQYPDGIVWFSCKRPKTSILSHIAYTFGDSISKLETHESKKLYIQSHLIHKKCLLVFDDIPDTFDMSLIMPFPTSCSVLFTLPKPMIQGLSPLSVITLDTFTEEETLTRFARSIGNDHVWQNKSKLIALGNRLKNLPSAIHYFAEDTAAIKKELRNI